LLINDGLVAFSPLVDWDDLVTKLDQLVAWFVKGPSSIVHRPSSIVHGRFTGTNGQTIWHKLIYK
jgi:hypothetical protein